MSSAHLSFEKEPRGFDLPLETLRPNAKSGGFLRIYRPLPSPRGGSTVKSELLVMGRMAALYRLDGDEFVLNSATAGISVYHR